MAGKADGRVLLPSDVSNGDLTMLQPSCPRLMFGCRRVLTRTSGGCVVARCVAAVPMKKKKRRRIVVQRQRGALRNGCCLVLRGWVCVGVDRFCAPCYRYRY